MPKLHPVLFTRINHGCFCHFGNKRLYHLQSLEKIVHNRLRRLDFDCLKIPAMIEHQIHLIFALVPIEIKIIGQPEVTALFEHLSNHHVLK